jgi:hypothetical protein
MLYEMIGPPFVSAVRGGWLKEWALDLRWALAGFLPHPLLVLGVLALLAQRWRLAWVAGALALLGGLSFLCGDSCYWGLFPTRHIGIGGYLWLGSMALVAATGAWRAYLGRGAEQGSSSSRQTRPPKALGL